jgi:hypothetical protein
MHRGCETQTQTIKITQTETIKIGTDGVVSQNDAALSPACAEHMAQSTMHTHGIDMSTPPKDNHDMCTGPPAAGSCPSQQLSMPTDVRSCMLTAALGLHNNSSSLVG